MKKSFLSLLLFTICYSNYAQLISEIGFCIGVSDSDLDWTYQTTPDDDYNMPISNKIGFNAHVLANLKSSKHFHLQGSLGYVEKGGKSSVPIIDIEEDYYNWIGYKRVATKYNYISVGFGGVGKVRWRDFELLGTLKPRMDVMVSSREPNIILGEVGKDIKTFNFGFLYGVGLNLKMNDEFGISFNVDHNVNFNNINDTAFEPGSFGLEIQDQTRFFNLGFTFVLKDKEIG